MCPTIGLGGYITPAAYGVPNDSERGTKSEGAHNWAGWLHNHYRPGGPLCFKAGEKSEVAHMWGGWLHNPCCLWGPHRFSAGGKMRSGAQMGRVAS